MKFFEKEIEPVNLLIIVIICKLFTWGSEEFFRGGGAIVFFRGKPKTFSSSLGPKVQKW